MSVASAAMGNEGSGDAAVLFDAILHPNASLSRRGFAVLMVAVGTIGLTIGGLFLISGAWPIFGLYGLDILIVYWAFRINYRDARRYEIVRLTADQLTVERGGPSRTPKTWSFQPYWLTVSMDDPPEHHSQLTLSSHGRSLVVGSFLSPDERHEFAEALRAALARAREPGALPA